jgi:hypothetical protein
MSLHTFVSSTPRLDKLIDDIILGEPTPFHQVKEATLLKYEQATSLTELRREIIAMVCINTCHLDYSLIYSRARTFNLH